MQNSQKIGIGIFLCLSICMIAIAGVRLSDILIRGNMVSVWQYFWLEIQACVAVCMNSLVAFRYFFVDHSKIAGRGGADWYSSAVARHKQLRDRRARVNAQREASDAFSLTYPCPSSDLRNDLSDRKGSDEANHNQM